MSLISTVNAATIFEWATPDTASVWDTTKLLLADFTPLLIIVITIGVLLLIVGAVIHWFK